MTILAGQLAIGLGHAKRKGMLVMAEFFSEVGCHTTVEGDADGTDVIADQDGGKTVVTRENGDESGCCACVEVCSTANMEVAPTCCDEPHELLQALGHVLESVQILSVVSKKLGAIDEGSYWGLMVDIGEANAVLVPLLKNA